ncbi:MAG TPA: GGDEF domain-containing protein [Ferrovibrio sp.]|jgi:diguanylate cyclase (GGDEF)-like protein|uniref:GGDEF domain-containing protein n=1 Tax=Ferrovibrio sp. TaxID=1917215 RepID=UPI002B4B4297|nr:GGDEF domain-containing protein [Ferrovibrio sp.]HLT77809.1 GGDEF domain-containing protein [Ferrovibrio sp.]
MARIEDRRPVGLGSGSLPVGNVGAGGAAARPLPVAATQGTAAAAPVAPPAATATVMGIPETELTPRVRDAIMRLMGEVDQLRNELNRTRHRLAELERLADRDTLTPLYNRRAFVRELSRAMAHVERYGRPSALIYFDLNGLKEINDKHGHAAGDAALIQVGQILLDNTREVDVLARLGGDEYGVILSETDAQQAREKADMLAEAIHRRPLHWEGKVLPLDAAYGVYPLKAGEDPGTALAAADQMMYNHKLARRAARA